jgi:hypothetical protein
MVAWPYLKGKCTLPTVDTTGNAQQRAYGHRLSFYSLLRRIPLQAFLEQALLFSFSHSELQICVLVPPSVQGCGRRRLKERIELRCTHAELLLLLLLRLSVQTCSPEQLYSGVEVLELWMAFWCLCLVESNDR